MADKKNNFDELMKKYQPVMKKTGDQLAKAVKVAEKDIAKMYKLAQTHVTLQMKHLKTEKLYHEIGKYAAGKILAGTLDAADMEKYKKRLEKFKQEDEKIKKKIASIRRRTPKNFGL